MNLFFFFFHSTIRHRPPFLTPLLPSSRKNSLPRAISMCYGSTAVAPARSATGSSSKAHILIVPSAWLLQLRCTLLNSGDESLFVRVSICLVHQSATRQRYSAIFKRKRERIESSADPTLRFFFFIYIYIYRLTALLSVSTVATVLCRMSQRTFWTFWTLRKQTSSRRCFYHGQRKFLVPPSVSSTLPSKIILIQLIQNSVLQCCGFFCCPYCRTPR